MENKNKVFIYLLIIFFAVFVGTGLFVGMDSKKQQSATTNEGASTTTKEDVATLKQENMVIPTVPPTVGALSLTSAASYALTDNVTLNLEGQSFGKNIVGYDTIIYYDPLSFEFIESKSNLADFKIYSYNRGNYLLLTAVKSLDSQTPTVLGSETGNQPMASIVFKPKKIGKSNFSLRQSAGQDVTDLVTDQTEVLNPALSDLSVEIK
jgi:hypothetical protein